MSATKNTSTAEEELAMCNSKLRIAEAEEWENPSDIQTRVRVDFWSKEVARLSIMSPNEIIPQH